MNMKIRTITILALAVACSSFSADMDSIPADYIEQADDVSTQANVADDLNHAKADDSENVSTSHKKAHAATKKAHATTQKKSVKAHKTALAATKVSSKVTGGAPVVYQHCNFGGYHRTVKRSVNWVKKMGVKNDDLSSIKVPAGKCVRLYEHIHYKGRSWTICGKKNIKCFVHHKMSKNKTWNDQVSSIKVFNKPQKKSKKSAKKGSSSAKYAAKKAALHRRKAYYAGRTERYYAGQERRFARKARWTRHKMLSLKNWAASKQRKAARKEYLDRWRAFKALKHASKVQRATLKRLEKRHKSFQRTLAKTAAEGKKAGRTTYLRLRMAKAKDMEISRKIGYEKAKFRAMKTHEKRVKANFRRWGRSIRSRYNRKVSQLKRSYAASRRALLRKRRALARYFAGLSAKNKHRFAAAKYYLKRKELYNKASERSAKRSIAYQSARENRGKKLADRRWHRYQAIAKKIQNAKYAREKMSKRRRAAEANRKYAAQKERADKRKARARLAKARAERAVKASERSSKAEKIMSEKSNKKDLAMKSCKPGYCRTGSKCHKVDYKKVFFASDNVNCSKKQTHKANSGLAWAGFGADSFPEAEYKEPKFVMPSMPGRL